MFKSAFKVLVGARSLSVCLYVRGETQKERCCPNAYPSCCCVGQATGQGDELVTFPGRRGWEEDVEVWIYRMTQQLLSPVFSRFL